MSLIVFDCIYNGVQWYCICVVGTLKGIFATTNKIDEPGAALVLTLESTQVSACSCQSLVSKGKFQGKI